MPLLMLGTRNRKKREEIVQILGDLPLSLDDLNDRPDVPEVEETGTTFEANARLKGEVVARATGEWTLAEDSGLVVPALNGRPGVFSARYAGHQGDDEANNDRLLAEMAPLSGDQRAAYYVCVVVLLDSSGVARAIAEGRCHGIITHERRGTNGFGYDPLFLIPEFHKTFGELSPRVKHAISHRARALERIRPAVRREIAHAP